MPANVICPACRAKFTVQIAHGQSQVECPECQKTFKIKRSASQQASPRAAPVAESFREASNLANSSLEDLATDHNANLAPLESFSSASLTPLSSDNDEYRLANEPLASLANASSDDMSLDLVAPLTPEPLRPAPAPAARQPVEKNTPKTDDGPGRKQWILLGAGGAAALVSVLGLVGWLLSGDGSQTTPQAANSGDSSPTEDAPSVSTSPPAQAGGESIEWFNREFVVVDRAPAGAKADEISHQNFRPDATAGASGPGGTAEAPAPWKAPPRSEATAPHFTPFRHYPAAWNDTHYITMGFESLTFAIAEHPGKGVIQTWWQRFDAKTNRPVGPRFVMSERLGVHQENATLPIGALSVDSQWFAHVDPDQPGQVEVWTKDGVPAGTIADPASQRVDWLAWDGEGHLLTLAAGALTSWSLPSGDSAWTLKKDKDTVVTMPPAKDWLAVGSGGMIDFIDHAGQSLGQLRYQPEVAVLDISLAPDQQKLAAIYQLPAADRTYHLVVWDLNSGKARHLNISHMGLRAPGASPENPEPPPQVRRLFWPGDEQLAVQDWGGGLMLHFVQLDGWAWLATFSSFQKSDMLDDPTPVFWGPGDRLWAGWSGERGSSYPVTLLSDKIPVHQEVLALMTGGADGKAPTFRLEVDAGSPEISQKRGEELARLLVSQGIVIGTGGDTLRIRYGVTDSGEKLFADASHKHEVPIPKLMAHYQWLDAQGKEVWTDIANGGFWNPMQTRYLVGRPELTYDGEVRHFNFRGDMRAAIVQEIIDDNRFRKPPPDEFMRRLLTPSLKPDTTLPLRVKAAFPSMDELSASPDLIVEARDAAEIGLLTEMTIPGQDLRAPQLLYSPDGTTLAVVAVVKQTRCLLTYDRASRRWVKATALTQENVIPAIASTLDRFAYHDQENTLVADALDPSRQLAIPQRGYAGLKVGELQLSASARRLSRVLSLEQNPDYPRRVELWYVAERRLGAKHVAEGSAVATAFSPDGALFAAADKQLRVWDTNSFEMVGSAPLATQIEIPIAGERVSRDAVLAGLAFSRDGKMLAAFTTHKANTGRLAASAIHFWGLEGSGGSLTLSQPISLPWRNRHVMALSLDRQGDRVAILSATNDWRPNHVELYSLARKVSLRRWTAAELGEPSAVAVSPEGDELAIAALDKIRIFDIKRPQEVAVTAPTQPIFLREQVLPPEAATLSPTPPPPAALQAATAAAPAVAKIRGFVSELPLPENAGAVQDLSFSENGRTIAVGVAEKKFLVYTLTGQKPSYDIAYQTPGDLRDDPHSVAEWVISPGHDRAAFLRRDGILCLFDRRPRSMPTVLNKRPVGERDYHELPVAAFSPDGRLLCFCQTTTTPTNPNRRPLLEAWDLRQGKRVHEVDGFSGDITHFAFAADGSLAVCIDSAVHLLDPSKDFARLGTLPIPDQSESLDPKQSAVAISSDGSTLAVARSRHLPGAQQATNTVCLWSSAEGLAKLAPGAASQELSQPGVVRSLALDAAGRWLFTVCDDEMMKERWLSITDAGSGQRLLELGPLAYGIDLSSQPHSTGEQDLGAARAAISPSGQQLALTTGKKVLMFDIQTLVGE